MITQGEGGSILLVSSIGAHCSVPGKAVSAYCASKGAVVALCRAIADELVHHNIRVNTISPGYVCLAGRNIYSFSSPIFIFKFVRSLLTEIQNPRFMLTDMAVRDIDKRPNILEELSAKVPMGRMGDRRDLKGAVVLLLSSASAYMTGSDLIIDGGLVSH